MKEAHFITLTSATSATRRCRLRAWATALIVIHLVSGSVDCALAQPSRSTPYLKILGIVQDGGLPHAACDCERCRRARNDPEQARHIASVALILPVSNEIYLFDATPDLRQQLAELGQAGLPPPGRVDRDPVAGIFLTHAHIGHYLGLAYLGYEAIHSQGLPVMATPRMAEFLRHNGPWSQLVSMRNIALEEMSPGALRTVDEGVTVKAQRAPHRDEFADTLGYLITGPQRSVFYLPDTDSWVAWESPITEILRQVDVAILDGTFFSADELPGRRVEEIGHPLIQDSMDLLQGLVDEQGLEVHFTHLNHSNAALDPHSEARQSIEERGFHVLEQGLEIDL